MILAESAAADCYIKAVDTTCVPETGYFSARIFGSYNLCYPFPNGEQGLYTLKDVASKGVSCELSGKKFELVADYNKSKVKAGTCNDNRTKLSLRLDGEQVLNIGTMFELCGDHMAGRDDRIIEVEGGGVKQCIIGYEDSNDEYRMPETLTKRSVECQRIKLNSK